MQFTIITVGRVKDIHLRHRIEDYMRRLGPRSSVVHKTVRDAGIVKEAEQILGLLDKTGGTVLALAEEGRQYTSTALSRRLFNLSGPVTFVVGGPDGLGDAVKERAAELLSLSKMTLPHDLAQLLLAEQIYRAVSIHAGSPYHRE